MKAKKQIFWGSFFILSAVLVLATGMNVLPGIEVKSIICTVLAAALLIHGIIRGSVFCMLFAVAFLAIIYAKPLGIEGITPWPVLGAALLLSIGFRLIFPSKGKRFEAQVTYTGKDGEEKVVNPKKGVETEESYCNADGEYLEFSQVFKSGTKYINSNNLKKIQMECVFSTMEVYLDNVVLQDGVGFLELDSVFSNVTIFVPGTWTIVENSETVFSKINYTGRSIPDAGHKLYLNGSCVFGGVKVVYI